MTQKDYKYKFSVVIPIYKVEEYLEETIESVINQDIGFKDNIQIILVNDDSPDNSEQICLKYREMYPNNIIYVKKENGGVSSARNKGIEYIEGKYTNFLDSDDKWELDVFTKAYKMFEKNDDVDVIGVRQKYFEAENDFLSLDYKFNRDKVVDIFNSYDHIQLSVTSGFIRTSAIGDIRFDTRVKYSEDSKFLYEVILQNEKLGIISSSLHLYRKRFSQNSAIQTKSIDKSWYINTPELCYKYVEDLSKEKYGYVIPFVQYYIAYDYQWRLSEKIPEELPKDILNEYLKISKELFQDVEDYIIMQQRNISPEHKAELLSFKYGYSVSEHLDCINHKLYFHNKLLVDFTKEFLFRLYSIDLKDNKIRIIGTANYYIPTTDYDIYMITNKEKIKLDLKPSILFKRRFLGRDFMANKIFEVETSLKDLKFIRFQLVYKEKYRTNLKFVTTMDSKIETKSKIYYKYKNKIMYYAKSKIKFKPLTFKNRLKFSYRNFKNLVIKKRFDIISIRIIYHITNHFINKKIWLISDRINKAGDNGEAFFKYVNSIKDKKIKSYFVISKKCEDYKKMKKYGKVIDNKSFKFKLLFLLSDFVISSQADDWFLNPFEKKHIYCHDLYNSKFVFLQHGITKDDLSPWLNTFYRKIDIFVTSSTREYNSLLSDNYGYKKNNLVLTGMPRYDYLENNPENLIVIMPTWRLNISGKFNEETKLREYDYKFANSEYFKFYNKLINDKDIISEMKKKGYKGLFVLHPCHKANIKDFKEASEIKIEKDSIDYKEIFEKAKLIVTDYSSVAFDFAYLKKPVIYTQFDEDEFFKQQLYDKGYYDYKKDGFGPVANNYEKTKEYIIDMIKNDCKLDKKYENRINEFFKFTDKQNCKRVYDEIKNRSGK